MIDDRTERDVRTDYAPPVDAEIRQSYESLEQTLREQLKRNPDLLLVRVMLCEVYFKAGKRNAFFAEARKLYQRIKDPETSFEWQRCANLGRKLDPDAELFRDASSALLDAAATATAAGLKQSRFGDQARDVECFRELNRQYQQVLQDRTFLPKLDTELLHTAGRPSSLLHLRNLSRSVGGAQIYLKREDQSPRDSHMVMMVTGQVLLARQLGCTTVVTSTVNGGRGLIAAAIAARLGLKCVIYMHREDSRRNMRNVLRMGLLSAELRSVDTNEVRNRDIREVALDHWIANPTTCLMVTGLDAVPFPYPAMHREFAAAIGRECRRQTLAATRQVPNVLVARGAGTADALGLFPPFLDDADSRLICVDSDAAPPPVEDDDAIESRALAQDLRRLAPDLVEGIDYPNVEREHAWLASTGRVEYVPVSDGKAVAAISELAKTEGLIPSLSTARALAWACEEARKRPPSQTIVVMYGEGHEKNLGEFDRVFGLNSPSQY